MIILAGTPIGNLGDASPRLREALETADVIAAEDTRNTKHLIGALGVTTNATFVSMHDYNEREKVDDLLDRAHAGTVLVVSDAGMPTVSDPGYDLVAAAAKAGVEVTVIPGPSAVITALAVSGLPSNRFSFEGFVPRKSGEQARRWQSLADAQRTTIHFESPHRLASTLDSMAGAFGSDRPAVVCRELTKKFEEVKRGTLAELAVWAREGVKGEIVIVVGPAAPKAADIDALVEIVLAHVANGQRLKTACQEVAAAHAVRVSELYDRAVARKGTVQRGGAG